jgi:ligand-binding SRPBCC domain-containing protein
MTQSISRTRTFEKTSVINCTLAEIKRFHAAPRALAALTPPPIIMRVKRDDRRSIIDGEIEFTLWLGPLPITWIARHEAGPEPDSFADAQVKGPLAYWRHEHIFREVAGGVELTDRIRLAHRSGLIGLLTRLAFDGIPLRLLFAYRHWCTRRTLQSK